MEIHYSFYSVKKFPENRGSQNGQKCQFCGGEVWGEAYTIDGYGSYYPLLFCSVGCANEKLEEIKDWIRDDDAQAPGFQK